MCTCCINTDIRGKLIRAFYLMFYGFKEGNRLANDLYSMGILVKFSYITEVSVIYELPKRSLERLSYVRNKRNNQASSIKMPVKKRKYVYPRKRARFPVPVLDDIRRIISLFHKVLITPPITRPFIIKLLKPLNCPVELSKPTPVQETPAPIAVSKFMAYVPRYRTHAKEDLSVYDEPLVMLHGCSVRDGASL